MTLEKMQHYMNARIYAHWMDTAKAGNFEAIKQALNTITGEIERGLLVGIEYQAEKQLLQYLAR